MNFSECRWQIPVNPNDKGNARDSGYSASHSARISQGGEQRRNDSHESYLQGDRAHSNGVETSAGGTRAITAIVPTIYMTAISTPAANTARGSVLCGSRISWLMAETSSRPVNAKAICDQKFTVSQFHTGKTFVQVRCVAEPCRSHKKPPRATSSTSGA